MYMTTSTVDAPAAISPTPNASRTDLDDTLGRLRRAWHANRPTLDQRRDDIKRLRAALKSRLAEMDAAIRADFGHRSEHENLLSEAMIVFSEIDHVLSSMKRWSRPRGASTGWRLWPASAQVRPSALGVIGILSPWNYPVNLALMPLVSAIAAGNHVYLKPSEHTPRTSEFLRALLAEVFPADRVAVALGDADVGAAFSALKFDHLLFTGSTAVGRKVMAAAAPHLTPVTLELGGKSPAIVCPDFDIDTAASRIATGKWFNAGQTCIGVDYVLVDAARRDAFVEAIVRELHARYPDLASSRDFTRIINDAQAKRLLGYVDDARARKVTLVEPFAGVELPDRMIAPILLIDPPDAAEVMQNEIFGPLLPVIGYQTVHDAIKIVNARERPLALYPFTHDADDLESILQCTLSGGVTVNDTLLHFGAADLPFGGVGPSGMGAIHGRSGFDTFSKLLPVFHQRRWTVTDWLKPPYTGRIDRIIRMLVR